MRTFKNLLIVVFAAGCAGSAMAQSPDGTTQPALSKVQMTVKLLSPISTKTSQPGDKFTVQVLSPEQYQGAAMEGHVQNVQKAQGNTKSEISFVFETLTSGNAARPIKAELEEATNSKGVKDVDEEGVAVGKSSSQKKLGAAAAGGVVGGILGGLHGGAKGAALGAGGGAAAGYLIAIAFTTSGTDMEFSPGSQFVLAVSDRAQKN